MPLVGFSEDIAFAGHFVATHPPPLSHPVGVWATDIGYASKILSKMAGNSASYSPNIWRTDRL